MIGIYIHVPFCVKKCSYCDFYSAPADESTKEKYVSAVIRNLKRYDITADTVYFGGGTPTLLSPSQTERILSVPKLSENAEISMECNPDTVTADKIKGFKSAGINRFSVGIQSLDDKELKAVGRIHDSERAVKCIGDICNSGIENISADIMEGLPFQTEKTLSATLRRLVSLPLTHISAYMLKIEENTPLSKNRELIKHCADDEELADMYLLVCDHLEKNGFERYEISNFAKKGFECKHNLKYWLCGDYIGIGPAAHSCFGGKRFFVPKKTEEFITDKYQTEIISEKNPLDEEERLMLNLRISNGIDPDEFSFSEKIKKRAASLIKAGFLFENDGRISLTDKGALVSNEIIVELIK